MMTLKILQLFTGNMGRNVVNYCNYSVYSSMKLRNSHNLQNVRNSNFLIFKRNKTKKSMTCWKCGEERKDISEVFCQKCKIIQTPHEKGNYFKVFDIDEKFDIDEQILKNKFRALQSLLHPDKFSNRTGEEQAISEEYSSLLNKAYNNLQVPLNRAEHLLHLNGEHIGEDQSVDDPAFLMNIMTLNEEVENAGNNIKKLRQLNAKNKTELEKICKEIDESFQSRDIQRAKVNTIKLKYFTSISKRLNAILRELGETE